MGKCSQSCNSGIRTNVRVHIIESQHGGAECNGPSNVTERCNIQNCPGS